MVVGVSRGRTQNKQECALRDVYYDCAVEGHTLYVLSDSLSRNHATCLFNTSILTYSLQTPSSTPTQ